MAHPAGVAILSVRVSLATIIAISSRLNESSDGFDFVFVVNDPKIISRILKRGSARIPNIMTGEKILIFDLIILK